MIFLLSVDKSCQSGLHCFDIFYIPLTPETSVSDAGLTKVTFAAAPVPITILHCQRGTSRSQDVQMRLGFKPFHLEDFA